MGITRKKIICYAVLPGLWPRISSLLGSGFSHLAAMMALIYSNVGLLPKDHAYLRPSNIGRFGVRHVIVEAARNLNYSWKHADQVIVFYLLLAGVIILSMQFIMLLVSIIAQPVLAGTFFQVFNLTDASGSVLDLSRYRQDMAFVVLDRTLGLRSFNGAETFFRSCLSLAGTCRDISGNTMDMPAVPTAFHSALHELFGFYSLGIAFLSSILLIYCIIAIVGETVTSGTPFGKRFNRAWFVPRLIVFFALIMPMNLSSATVATENKGMNAAQYITLGAAKFGSNMATNAWNRFGTTLLAAEDTYLGTRAGLIAKPNIPEMTQLTQFMYVVRMCMFAEMIINNKMIYPYVVRENSTGTLLSGMGGTVLNYLPYSSTSFANAVEFARYGQVVIRFGELNMPDWMDAGLVPGGHDSEMGFVEPTCGELVFKTESQDPYVIGGGGVTGIQESYYLAVGDYLAGDIYTDQTAYCMLSAILPYDHNIDCLDDNITSPVTGTNLETKWPKAVGVAEQARFYNMMNRQEITGDFINASGTVINNIVGSIIGNMRASYAKYAIPTEIRERGWAGAALWYNKIAEVNGMVMSAVKNIPVPSKYPKVMEEIAAQHKAADQNYSATDRFNPLLENGQLADLPNQGDQYKAAAFYSAYNFWETADPSSTPHNKNTGNAVMDAINLILGTDGLIDIRDNSGTHPLAMLSALGKGMVDAALTNMFAGGVGKGLAVALASYFPGEASIAKTAGAFFFKIALIGFSIGFVLYYVLPLMPFIYFFFAFGGWIKSIFEALVAMPLWALAHIKIDGEGLPGPFATNGYFLLLEILIRPTLIIVGFICSISLFGALVNVLHTSFSEYILNVGGSNAEKMISNPITHNVAFMMGPINELFYTVLYTIIVYMIGVSCFKMIDGIPNNILRWMGTTVTTFHETSGDPASELQGRMFRSAQMGSSQLETLLGRSADDLTQRQIALGGIK